MSLGGTAFLKVENLLRATYFLYMLEHQDLHEHVNRIYRFWQSRLWTSLYHDDMLRTRMLRPERLNIRVALQQCLGKCNSSSGFKSDLETWKWNNRNTYICGVYVYKYMLATSIVFITEFFNLQTANVRNGPVMINLVGQVSNIFFEVVTFDRRHGIIRSAYRTE